MGRDVRDQEGGDGSPDHRKLIDLPEPTPSGVGAAMIEEALKAGREADE